MRPTRLGSVLIILAAIPTSSASVEPGGSIANGPRVEARHGCSAEAETWRGLPVCEEQPRDGYDRDAFGSAYSRLEDDIINMLPATMRAGGRVYTPYSCLAFDIGSNGAAQTDIEHIVALAEAHDSGIADADRRDIASDLDNLTIADPRVNRTEKSDGDAADWVPARHGAWFAQRVVQVKRKYGLSVDPAERDALEALLGGGGSQLHCVDANTRAAGVVDLPGGDWSGAAHGGADLTEAGRSPRSRADLRRSLSGAQLSRAHLTGPRLRRATYVRGNVREPDAARSGAGSRRGAAAQLPYGLPLGLPADIMLDKYVSQLDRRVGSEQYESAVLIMDDIAALHERRNVRLPSEFHFWYAKVALLAIEKAVRRRGVIEREDYRRLAEAATRALEQYVTVAGRAGEHYTEALIMLDALEVDTPWRRP